MESDIIFPLTAVERVGFFRSSRGCNRLPGEQFFQKRPLLQTVVSGGNAEESSHAQAGLPYRLGNGSLWNAFSRVAEPSGGRLLDCIHFGGSDSDGL